MKEFLTALAMIIIIIAVSHFTGYIDVDLSVLLDSRMMIDHFTFFGG